jgi:hypothetical protein
VCRPRPDACGDARPPPDLANVQMLGMLRTLLHALLVAYAMLCQEVRHRTPYQAPRRPSACMRTALKPRIMRCMKRALIIDVTPCSCGAAMKGKLKTRPNHVRQLACSDAPARPMHVPTLYVSDVSFGCCGRAP